MIAAALSLCSSALFAGSGEDLSNPVEILQRADAAAKAVKVVQYTAKTYEFDGTDNPVLFQFSA